MNEYSFHKSVYINYFSFVYINREDYTFVLNIKKGYQNKKYIYNRRHIRHNYVFVSTIKVIYNEYVNFRQIYINTGDMTLTTEKQEKYFTKLS